MEYPLIDVKCNYYFFFFVGSFGLYPFFGISITRILRNLIEAHKHEETICIFFVFLATSIPGLWIDGENTENAKVNLCQRYH